MTPHFRHAAFAALLLTCFPGTALAQTFSPAPSFMAGNDRKFVEVADIDGDGNLDFATGGTNVGIFWGNGDLSGTSFAMPITIQPTAQGGLAIGNIDGDGDLDIVVANGIGAPIQGAPGILIHENQGSRTFTQALTVTTPSFAPNNPNLGDLDGNGSLDFVFHFGVGGSIEGWINDGTGSFTPDFSFPVAGSSLQDLTLADVDNDGDLDLISGEFNGGDPGTIRIRLNDGSGNFGANGGFLSGSAEANDLEFADTDSDGDLDLLVARPDIDDVALFINNGSGSFGSPTSILSATNPWSTSSADFDNDGTLDLAITRATGPGSLEVLLNNGDGTFATPESYAIGNLAFRNSFGDLDDDGDQEIIVGNFANFSIFENDTDPRLAGDTLTLSLAAGGTHALALRAGASHAGDIYWLLGSVTGTSPGIDFGGGLILPLNFDAYFNLILTQPGLGAFNNFRGILDGNGEAAASLSFPPGVDPTLAGATLTHAFIGAATLGIPNLTSNAVGVRLTL